MELFSLDLRSAIAYAGLENPAIAGAPLRGAALVPAANGSLSEVGLGEDMSEGDEEIFFFDEHDLVAFDDDDGPLVKTPLPSPRFYGRRIARAGDGDRGAGSDEATANGERRTSPSSAVLEAGAYAFLQWRPADESGLFEGLEWFARETWWARTATSGPYIVRRVREDGRLATQVLRRIS